MTPPLVSAVVPVFNGERFLAQALDSGLRQTMDSVELIVVNDGSTDHTGEIAQEYVSRYGTRVVYVEQANAGLPSARNTAIRVAQGRYLALLDSDDVWLPEHLETLVPVLEADARLALAHANIKFISSDSQDLWTPRGRWVSTPDSDAFRALFLRREHVSCPTVVCRRDVVVALGGFDPAFSHLGCEDRDLWLRISAHHAIRYVHKTTACYRVHPTSMSRNLTRMRTARVLLIAKHAADPPGKRLRRAAMASVDVETGTVFLEQGERLKAAWFFGRGLLQSPSIGSAWRGLVASAWPFQFQGRARPAPGTWQV